MNETKAPRGLRGKVAVVTGGSSGIGAATAAALATEGAQVVIGYHHGKERAEELRESLPGKGHRSYRIPLNDALAHEELAQDLLQHYGHLDVLVNSAGYTTRIAHRDIDQLDSDVFNDVLLTNVGGPYSIIRSLMPLLFKSEAAAVVSISSVSAFTGSGSNIAYCAAKAALDTMTLSLARVFGPQVRFLALSPASVDTDFVPGRSREEVARKGAATPLGRAVTAQDVALAVVGCLTHLRTATGSRIVIDGGFTL